MRECFAYFSCKHGKNYVSDNRFDFLICFSVRMNDDKQVALK